ncbi:hypothetical protein [Halobaculum roseum]|uniref:DUF4157 domain-containing protein n=1 Tax=Halobaculum roseum TaxID=2175149 RepID=A0ABD5MLZ5_9EURY|nr:hypothetical protein [Halobaculum roseum]QZY02757.1 hypothetical protein K6T36_00715 [Halobaculum roseum]
MSIRALLLAALLVIGGCAAPAVPPATTEGDPAASDHHTTSGGSPDATISTVSPSTPSAQSPQSTQPPAESPQPSPGADGAAANTSEATPPSPRALADGYDVRVSGGSLPVEYPLVFARVAVTVDRPTVEPPSVVRVEPNESMELGGSEYPEFYRLLGFSVGEERGRALTAAAYVASAEAVVVNEAVLADAADAESTLAHESVHVVQFRTGAFEDLDGTAATPPGSTASRLLRAAIIEGSATYVQGEYVRRYAPEAPRPTESLRARAANGSAATRLGAAPYLAGARYVDGRVSDPGEVREVYADPPRTAEELLHDRPPGSEPLAALAVRDAPGDGWTSDGRARDTYGELFVRTLLETSVDEPTAADAAHGWDNDVRRRFVAHADDGSTHTGYAWAIRFEDAANATAFAAAFETWRADRPANASTVRLVRAAPGTVVVLLGDERFVTRATASGTDGAVTLRVNETG